jgi:hypothetical protein
MSLDIKYYNPYSNRYSVSSDADDANESADGTVYLNNNSIILGNDSGNLSGDSQYAFFRFVLPSGDAINLQDKTVLPDTSLVLPITEYWDFPWSGRLYCELTPSSVPLDGSVSGISTRVRTSAYFELDHSDFEPVKSYYNDRIYGYWPLNESSGFRHNRERFKSLPDMPFYEVGHITNGNGMIHEAASGFSQTNFLRTSGLNIGLPAENFLLSFYFKVDGTTPIDEFSELVTVAAGENHSVQCMLSGDADCLIFRLDGDSRTDTGWYQEVKSGEWLSGTLGHITLAPYGVYELSGYNFFNVTTPYNNKSLSAYSYDYVNADTFNVTTVDIGGQSYNNELPFVISDVILWSGGVYGEGETSHRDNSFVYPLLNHGMDTANYSSPLNVKTSLSYGPFGPVQELIDNYGSGLSTVSFIYEHLDGSGNCPIQSYASGGLIGLDLALCEKIGQDIPDVPVNSGLLLYWDLDSRYDRINCTPLFSPASALTYGGIFKSGIYGLHTTDKIVFNTGDKQNFIGSSSIHPQDDQSYVYWSTAISDYGTQLLGGFTKYKSPQDSAVSWGIRDESFFPLSGNLSIYQSTTKRSSKWLEKSRLSMFFVGYNSTTNSFEYSENGNPKESFSAATLSDASGNLSFLASNSIISEMRVYDRTLGDEEIRALYNGGFPSQLNKPSPKVQVLYPISDNMGIVNSHSPRLLHGEKEYTQDCQDLDDFYFQDPFDFSLPYNKVGVTSASGKFFSAINPWYGAYEDVIFNVNHDHVAITPYGNAQLKFGLGAAFVKPSAIYVHFGAKCAAPRSIYDVVHNSGELFDGLEIQSVQIVDRDKNPVTVSNGAIIDVGLSGNYGLTPNYIHYTSGLTLDPGIDYRDLSDLEISFTFGNAGNNSIGMLHSLAVEIQGETNIAQTGLSLYTDGVYGANSGIDLYTTAIDSRNSGIDLYALGHSVASSSIPMYTISADFGNSGINLYSYGRDTIGSGVNLYTVASESMSSNVTFFVSGIGRPSSEIDLFLVGDDSYNSGIDLFMHGDLSVSDGIDLWTEGVNIHNESIPFFAEASISYGSGGFPLYTNSTTNTSLYKARPMYLQVGDQETSKGSMPLFLNSITAGTGDQYMPFYLDSDVPDINLGTDLFLKNAYESGFKSQFLYVRGLGSLNGGSVGNGSMPLFIERIEGGEKGMSMYLGVNSGDEQGVNMYTYGGTWSTSGVDLVIPSTVDTKNSGITFYVNGL